MSNTNNQMIYETWHSIAEQYPPEQILWGSNLLVLLFIGLRLLGEGDNVISITLNSVPSFLIYGIYTVITYRQFSLASQNKDKLSHLYQVRNILFVGYFALLFFYLATICLAKGISIVQTSLQGASIFSRYILGGYVIVAILSFLLAPHIHKNIFEHLKNTGKVSLKITPQVAVFLLLYIVLTKLMSQEIGWILGMLGSALYLVSVSMKIFRYLISTFRYSTEDSDLP